MKDESDRIGILKFWNEIDVVGRIHIMSVAYCNRKDNMNIAFILLIKSVFKYQKSMEITTEIHSIRDSNI